MHLSVCPRNTMNFTFIKTSNLHAMHTPTYSAYVPHMLSTSANSRTVPPVTRPLKRAHPHPSSAPSPTHTQRPCHASSMLRLCVSQDTSRKWDQQDRERATKKFISYGDWLVRVWKLSLLKTSSQQGDPRCSSSPAMKPQNQES